MNGMNEVNVTRLDSECIIVDYIVCRKIHGVYCATSNHELGERRIEALFEFIEDEKRLKSKMDMKEAEKAVNLLLLEINFKYKQN